MSGTMHTKGGTAWVIEGGGLRAAFVAGALQRLVLDPELAPSHVFATSAGAASAAYMVAGQMEEALRIWRERTHGRQLISFSHPLRGKRIMDIDGLMNVFRTEMPIDVEGLLASTMRLTVAVTNCDTGQVDHLRPNRDNLFELLRATMALPVVYGRVVRVAGAPYIDGGVTDPIPLRAALDAKPERIIVISTRPRGFRKRPARFGIDLVRHNYRSFPRLWPALRDRWKAYNERIELVEQLEAEGKIMVIRPGATLPASRLTRSRERILSTLSLGHAAANAVLPPFAGSVVSDIQLPSSGVVGALPPVTSRAG